jgi:hypothetical protein
MSGNDPWIEALVNETRDKHPLIAEGVSSLMVELMTRQLTQHQLSKRQLSGVAKALIGEMVGAPPKTDADG